ncbi:MAG: hypothetical protein ABW032_04910 [Burkholderiaceae bacterium]
MPLRLPPAGRVSGLLHSDADSLRSTGSRALVSFRQRPLLNGGAALSELQHINTQKSSAARGACRPLSSMGPALTPWGSLAPPTPLQSLHPGPRARQPATILGHPPGPGEQSLVWRSFGGKFGIVARNGKPKIVDDLNQVDDALRRSGIPWNTRDRATRKELRESLSDLESQGLEICSKRPPMSRQCPAMWFGDGGFCVRVPFQGDRKVASLREVRDLLNGQLDSCVGDAQDPEATQMEALRSQHGIDITPLVLDGRVIGHVFGGGKENPTLMLSCHGNGKSKGGPREFEKPATMDFNFAAPRNTVLGSSTVNYLQDFRNGRVSFDDPSQTCDQPGAKMIDYRLSGRIGTKKDQMAELVGAMKRDPARKQFDTVLLNQSEKLRFSDFLRAVEQTFGDDTYQKMVCHFCRPEQADAPRVRPRGGPPPATGVPSAEATTEASRREEARRALASFMDASVGAAAHTSAAAESGPSAKPAPGVRASARARDVAAEPARLIATLRPKYAREASGAVFGTKVLHLSERARRKYRVTFDQKGRMWVPDPNYNYKRLKLLDSSRAKPVFGMKAGRAIVARGLDGHYYACTRQAVGKFHHSSFLAGDDGLFFGEWVAHKGVLREMNPKSNHYRTTRAQMDSTLDDLRSKGALKGGFKPDYGVLDEPAAAPSVSSTPKNDGSPRLPAHLRIPMTMLLRDVKDVAAFQGLPAQHADQLWAQYADEEIHDIVDALQFAADHPNLNFLSLMPEIGQPNREIHSFLCKTLASIREAAAVREDMARGAVE